MYHVCTTYAQQYVHHLYTTHAPPIPRTCQLCTTFGPPMHDLWATYVPPTYHLPATNVPPMCHLYTTYASPMSQFCTPYVPPWCPQCVNFAPPMYQLCASWRPSSYDMCGPNTLPWTMIKQLRASCVLPGSLHGLTVHAPLWHQVCTISTQPVHGLVQQCARWVPAAGYPGGRAARSYALWGLIRDHTTITPAPIMHHWHTSK